MSTRAFRNDAFDAVVSRGAWLLVSGVMDRIAAVRREWAYARAQRTLEAMSAHQLRDLGIRRADIPFVVRGERPVRNGG